MAERQRRHLIPNLYWGDGCRCCYDPNSDGGEYRALMEAREVLGKERDDPEEEQDEQDQQEQQQDQQQQQQDQEQPSSGSDDEFDYLLDDDFDDTDKGSNNTSIFAEMEDRRRAELELSMFQRESALQHGYGAHRQMHPSRVLRAAGLGSSPRSAMAPPPGVVLHLYDPESPLSASLDLYLEGEAMAQTNKGTKFLRGSGRSVLLLDADLAARTLRDGTTTQTTLRPEYDLPALVAIRDGVVVAVCPRLQGLSKDDQIDPSAVQEWLNKAGVLIVQPLAINEICVIRPEEMALYDYMPNNKNHLEHAPPLEPRYICGNPTCHKAFPHNHVGMSNSVQDGLLVQEEQVVESNVPSSLA